MSNNSRKAALLTGLKIHEKFKVSLILAAISRTDECQCYSENFPMFSEEAEMELSEQSATFLQTLKSLENFS